jgi:hypothetical protein
MRRRWWLYALAGAAMSSPGFVLAILLACR